MSLHRLKITYLNEEGKNRYLLISPKNKSEFLDKLEDDGNIQTALWVVIAYFFDICDIGRIE